MTIATKYMPDHYTISSGSNRYFPISFDFLNTTHIKVVITDQTTGANLLLSQGADFSVSGTTVHTAIQHPAGDRVTIYMDMPNLQLSDYQSMGRLDLEVLEEDFDYAALARQVIESDIGYLGTGLDISNALPQDLLESCEGARGVAVASASAAESSADDALASAEAAAVSAQDAQDVADIIGDIDFGVESITAGTNITLGGTAKNPIINSTSVIGALKDISRILFDSTTTTPTTASQENIDDITDNGHGDFDLNFESNITSDGTGAAVDYTWAGSAESDNTSKGTFTVSSPSGGTKTTSLLQINVVNEVGNLKDSDNISVMVFPAGDT